MQIETEHLFQMLRAEMPLLQERFSVRRLGVFGSRIRGEAGSESDIDFLVTFAEPTFDHYMGLKLHLEDLFRCRIDVVMETALRPRLRQHILREVRYAA
jgi:hypothetical protein